MSWQITDPPSIPSPPIPEPGECTFTIQFNVVTNDNVESTQGSHYSGYYLKITTHDASYDGVTGDNNVFVYQREVADPSANPPTYASFFTSIATPSDLQEITATTEPAAISVNPCVFRLNYVEAYFRSRALRDTCILDITHDIDLLMRSLKKRCANLAAPTTVTVTG